jgi:hypothetical protein
VIHASAEHAVGSLFMSEGSAVDRLAPRPGRTVAAPSDTEHSAMEPLWRRAIRHIYWPLAAVLAVQAAFSLSLVWSNSAYGDEAEHILDGQREWSHLLHGTPLPPYSEAGARQIYPLIGAAANSVGGLPAARIVSLCFMLASSVLLYQTGVRLVGRTAALAGVALWAVSEPVLRLAFATWDPLACLLTIASLRLAVQAGDARRKGGLIAVSALTLALAGVTALPFLIYIPVVIAVALLAWLEPMGARRAIRCAGWLTAGSAVLVIALMTFLHLWSNVFGMAGHHSVPISLNGAEQVFKPVWLWDGLILVTAGAGAVTAVIFEHPRVRGILVAALAASALPVPLYEVHIGYAFALDKQISAGTGMAALAAGYLLARLRPRTWRPPAVWLAAGVLMLYPAITGLWYARSTFHSWPDTTRLIAVLKPFATSRRPVLFSGEWGVFPEYYLGGYKHWPTYRRGLLPSVEHGMYAAVVVRLRLSSVESPSMAANFAAPPAVLGREALKLMYTGGGLLSALNRRDGYKLVTVIVYKTTNPNNAVGAWAVWEHVG